MSSGCRQAELKRRIDRAAAILHLDGVLDRLPGQIAEGEKQRVAVARAIIRTPNCFLFDEPLSRLDVELRQSMRGQIKEVLRRAWTKATVIVTHDQLEALTMADRVAIMRDGVIEQIGSPHEVFARPVNTFVAGFIGTPQMNLIAAASCAASRAAAPPSASARTASASRSIRPPRAPGGTDDDRDQAPRPRPGRCRRRRHLPRQGRADRADGREDAGALVAGRPRPQGGAAAPAPRDTSGETLHLRCDPRQTHIFDEAGKAIRS